MKRHRVDWARVGQALELCREIQGVSLREVSRQTGIPASGLVKLRNGGHLSADALACLVGWMFPHSYPTWIKEVDE